MNMSFAVALLMFAAVCTNTAAQGIKAGELTLKNGNWTVYRSINKMTDAVVCTGIYKDDTKVQLSDSVLFLKVTGGVDGITLRFGDKEARRSRLASTVEKKLSAVEMDGADFAEFLSTNRLRGSVLTLIRGVAEIDLDTTGAQEAVDHMRDRCPIPPPPVVSAAKAPIEIAKEVRVPVCSTDLITKLRASGVTASQVAKACGAI